MEVPSMQSGFTNRRVLRLRALLAAVVAAGLFSGFSVARNVWASEPMQGTQRNQVTKAPIPAAAVAPLADIENAFMSIAERMEPSVVSIRISKTMRTAGLMQGPG